MGTRVVLKNMFGANGFEMGNMVEASGLHAETKGKWNVGGRTLPVIACYVHNLPTIQ